MTIPPRFLDEIRSRVALSDIVGKRVRLTRAGREFKGCCPFHKEKSPSFTVNDDKQFYHCFGCGAHGDVIGFVMQHDNLSFIDAVESLSALAGLQMPKPSKEEVQKAERARDLHTLMETASQWMQQQLFLPQNREILNYLTGRGLTRDAMTAFRLGYAPPGRQELRTFLKSQGYEDAAMIEAGILKKSEKGGEPYVFFRERVIFPVTDRRGRIVAFGGRVLPEHLRVPDNSDFKPAKYINSSDTPLFDKGRMLYGESFARQAAREGKPLLVTEGYMDVIACHQAGFTGAVAPMGTALTENQIVLLWSMIPADEKVPVLCFDGDNAGRNAAVRSCERILPLLKPGQSVRFAFLPEGEDPDSLIKAGGAQAFQSILDSALSLMDFIWLNCTAGRDLNTPELKAGVIQTMQNDIKKIADRNVQMFYSQELEARIAREFFPQRQKFGGSPSAPRPQGLKPRKPMVNDNHERIFIAAIINHPHIYSEVEEELASMEIQAPALNRLRQGVISALNNDHALDSEGLRHHLSSSGHEKELSDILSESVYVHASFARPQADGEQVAGKWRELWISVQERRAGWEVEKAWKPALRASSQEEEEKLRHMTKGNII